MSHPPGPLTMLCPINHSELAYNFNILYQCCGPPRPAARVQTGEKVLISLRIRRAAPGLIAAVRKVG